MSYRKKHIKSRIHKIKPKRSIFTRPWFWIVFLSMIIVLSISYFLIFYSGIQLKNIVISGNEKVKTQDLQGLVFEDANTELINFWNLKIASRSIFLIDESKINKDILEKFPEVERLAINKNLPQTLTLAVTERKPLGVFCPDSSGNGCFSIDANGVTFGPVTTVIIGTTIVRQSGESARLFAGEEVIAQNIINAIYTIQKALNDNFKMGLKEALVASPDRLNIITNDNWQIYFDLSPDYDINSQLTKLNLLLGGGISPDDMKNLHYIDLRPKDKAIVCDDATCGG